jgi:ferredoxin
VALDSILALIMGLEPLDIPATKEAAKRKVGEASQEAITVLGESLEDLDIPPFILPSSTAASRIPVPIARLARKFIRYLPYSLEDKCIRCQACVKACPKKIIRISKAKIVFDYSGCISCFCCQEVCPAAAIKIRKSLLAKMIGL